jgi:hypothetical protein
MVRLTLQTLLVQGGDAIHQSKRTLGCYQMKERRIRRRRQSAKDKENYFHHLGAALADPLKLYRGLLTKDLGSDAIPIPNGLINLFAEMIVLLLTKQRISSEEQDRHHTSICSTWTLYAGIQRILKLTNLSYSSFLVAILYIHRFRKRNTLEMSYQRAFEMFVAAIIVADKYLYDATFSNKDWVSFAGFRFTLVQLNRLERLFLNSISYQVYVRKEDYLEFIEYLDMMLCRIQIRNSFGLGSFRYSDFIRLSGSFGRWNVAKLKKYQAKYRFGDTVLMFTRRTVQVAFVYLAMVLGLILALMASNANHIW